MTLRTPDSPLYAEILLASNLRQLGPGVDHDAVGAGLVFSKALPEAQETADYVARVSSRDDWADAPVPSVAFPAGAYWLEWRLPEEANRNCAGASIAVLVESAQTPGGGSDLMLTCFMQQTAMLRVVFWVEASGCTPIGMKLTDLIQLSRGNLPITASPVRDDNYNATLSWIFLVPTLLTMVFALAGGVSAVDSLLRSRGDLASGRTLPQALDVCRQVLRRPHPEAETACPR